LLDPETERRLLAKPEKLIELVSSLESGDICIVDEIQRVPDLIPVIHSLIEKNEAFNLF